MERTFFFLGFCPPSIQAVWRGFNSDSVLRKLFSGDMDFRKTETNLFFLHFVRAEEGSGEESARASDFLFFADRFCKIKKTNLYHLKMKGSSTVVDDPKLQHSTYSVGVSPLLDSRLQNCLIGRWQSWYDWFKEVNHHFLLAEFTGSDMTHELRSSPFAKLTCHELLE